MTVSSVHDDTFNQTLGFLPYNIASMEVILDPGVSYVLTTNASGGNAASFQEAITSASTSLTFVVPEPGSICILAIGAMGVLARRRSSI
jgi:hypothetical protein